MKLRKMRSILWHKNGLKEKFSIHNILRNTVCCGKNNMDVNALNFETQENSKEINTI